MSNKEFGSQGGFTNPAPHGMSRKKHPPESADGYVDPPRKEKPEPVDRIRESGMFWDEKIAKRRGKR
jgi:hypothetical protein